MKSNNSFLITGASSYIGKALVKYYSGAPSNRILMSSRSASEELSSLQSENILYLPNQDLSTDSGLDVLFRVSKDFFTGSFHVINCLGYFPGYKLLVNTSLDEAKRVLDSNVLSVFGVAHRMLPLMCKRGGGHFVTFSMHTTYQCFPYMSVFTAAKSAVECLTKGISNEYLKYNIYANVISLSTLLTEKELDMKPHGDYVNWLKPDEVCMIVDNLICNSNGLINGTLIHTYKYSDTYFGESYLGRIEKDNINIDED